MTSPIDHPLERAGRRSWAAVAVLSLATMMITFDLFVLLLALPGMSADLQPTSVEQLWIVDVYGFAVGGLLITMGTLGDRIGRRRLLLIGAAFFAAASVISAYSISPQMLIAARALLGIAGATLAPCTLGLIRNMFPDEKQRGVAIGMWAASFTLGAILGPITGGVMLANFWWGSVFLLAVPVMLLLLVLVPVLVPEFKDDNAGRLDLGSVVLSMAAVLGLVFAFKEIARDGLRPLLVGVCVASIVIGAAFLWRQTRLESPLIDLALFRHRSFSVMLTGLLLYGLVGATTLLYITQYFQSVAGLTSLEAAFGLLPGMLTATLSATLSPLLARLVRPAYLIGCGLLGVAAVFIWFTQVGAEAGLTALIVGFAIIGLCDGPLLSLGTGLVIGNAPPEKAGSAASVAQVANEGGAALGVAVLGSVGAAVYRVRITTDMPLGVPEPVAGSATESVATAVAEVPGLPTPLGEALLAAARSAFTSGFNAFAAAGAVIVVLAAVLVLIVLRQVPPLGLESDAAEDRIDAAEKDRLDPAG